MLTLLFGTSIASLWSPLSRVSALYWYYKNYGFNICVMSFSFYSIQLLLWIIFQGQNCVFVIFIVTCECAIDTTKIAVSCMSSLLLSIDLRRFYYFIMFYFILTNGAMVKCCMVKWCNGEINNRTGNFFSHKYWICSFLKSPNTNVLHQTKQFIIFNFWSLTTSTETNFIS